MSAVYTVMWLLIALTLLYMGIKEQRIYIVFSVYFLFNSIWWGIGFFTQADMFHGIPGWIFRGITAIFLIIAVLYYYFYRKKNETEQK